MATASRVPPAPWSWASACSRRWGQVVSVWLRWRCRRTGSRPERLAHAGLVPFVLGTLLIWLVGRDLERTAM